MYKIGSFNCRHLAMASAKDIRVFANVILKEDYDIIALQEVSGQAGVNRLLAELSTTRWKGVADDRSHGYGFLWNTYRFELAHTEKAGEPREYTPRVYRQYKIDRKSGQEDLLREPFFARFFPVGGAAPFIEIRLINTHIRFSKGSEKEEQNVGAVLKRKNEFDILTRSIYAKEEDKRYGNNRPAYTIMLGDYNLNLPSSGAAAPYLVESFEIYDGKNEKKVIRTIQKEKTTIRREIREGEDPFANNYDHFTIDENRFRDTNYDSRRINAVERYCGGDYEKYKKDVSDHVPIMMELNIKKEEI